MINEPIENAMRPRRIRLLPVINDFALFVFGFEVFDGAVGNPGVVAREDFK